MIITFHKSLLPTFTNASDAEYCSLNPDDIGFDLKIEEQHGRIGLCIENPVLLMMSIFSLWEHGLAPIIIRPDLPKVRLSEIKDRYSIDLILSDIELPILTPKRPNELINKQFRLQHHKLFSEINSEAAVYLFSSGSSGKQKLARISFANLHASASMVHEQLNLTSDDRWLLTLPLYHISGFSIFIRCLYVNSEIIAAYKLKNKDLADFIERLSVTRISLVPRQLYDLVNITSKPLHSLKTVLLGGARCERDILISAIANGYPIVKSYGSTETCAFIACAGSEEIQRKPESVGKPLKMVKIKIEQPEAARDGHYHGRIRIESPTVIKGYLDDDLETKNSFNEDGFLTGDIGYLDQDGYLYVDGRADETIISGGEKIDISEIREALLTDSRIKEAFIFGLPDSHWGETVNALLFCGEVAERLTKEMLNGILRELLPNFKLPKRYFLSIGPITNNLGKFEKEALRKAVLEGIFTEIL